MATDIEVISKMKSFYDSKRNGETYESVVQGVEKTIVDLSKINKFFEAYLNVIESGNIVLQEQMERYFADNGIEFENEQMQKIQRTKNAAIRKITEMYLDRKILNIPKDAQLIIENSKRLLLHIKAARSFTNARFNDIRIKREQFVYRSLSDRFLRKRFKEAEYPYEFASKVNWKKMAPNDVLTILSLKKEISGLNLDIQWNDEQTDRILDVAEENLYIEIGNYQKNSKMIFDRPITYFPEGIKWTQERIDRAIGIVEKSQIKYIDGFDPRDIEQAILFCENNVRKEIFPTGVEYTLEQRKRILDIARKNKMLIMLPTDIEWNEEEKNIILDIAEENGSLFGLPDNIKWSQDNKERIWGIARKNTSIIGLPQNLNWSEIEKYELLRIASLTKNIYSLPQNESWNSIQSKIILQLATQESVGVARFPYNMVWEENVDKNIILDFIRVNATYASLRESKRNYDNENREIDYESEAVQRNYQEEYGINHLLKDGINYNVDNIEKKIKNKINLGHNIRLLSKAQIYLPQNLDYLEDDVSMLLDAFERTGNYKILPQNVKYTKEQLTRLIDIISKFPEDKKFLDLNAPEIKAILSKIIGEDKKRDEAIEDIIDGIVELNPELSNRLKYYDPITCTDLVNAIDFDYAPGFTHKEVDMLDDASYQYQKDLMFQIFDRLSLLQVIDSGLEIDEKKFGQLGNVNENVIRERLEKLDPAKKEDRIQISTNLAFWINKLTKYINVQMYTRALENTGFYESVDERDKNDLKDNAEFLINAVRFLHGGDPNLEIEDGIPLDRNSSYTYMAKKNNIKKSFYDYIQTELIEEYKRTGKLKVKEKGAMKDFNIAFNTVLKRLQIKSSDEEILRAFEYSGKSLDLMGQLYEIKDNLISHFIQYGIKEEYKDQIVVRKKKDEKAENSYQDVLYVFVNGIARPLSFHCKLKDKDDAEKIEEVSDEVKMFCETENNGINVIYPIYAVDYESFVFSEKLIDIVEKIKPKQKSMPSKYMKLFKVDNKRGTINNGNFFSEENINTMNEFLIDVLSVDGEIKEDLSTIEFFKKGENDNSVVVEEKWKKVVDDKIKAYKEKKEKGELDVEEYFGVLTLAKVLYDRCEFVFNGTSFVNIEKSKGVDFPKIMNSILNSSIHKLSDKDNERREFLNPFIQGLPKVKQAIGYVEPDWEGLSKKKQTDAEIIAERDQTIAELEAKVQSLQEHLKDANDANERMHGIFGKLMVFADKVRNSPFGKIFFRKEIKSLPPADDKDDRLDR